MEADLRRRAYLGRRQGPAGEGLDYISESIHDYITSTHRHGPAGEGRD